MIEVINSYSTELFVGSEECPFQIQRVILANRIPAIADTGEPVTVCVEGAGITTPEPVAVSVLPMGSEREIEVPVAVDPEFAEGTRHEVTVCAEWAENRVQHTAELTVAVPGWTMFMVPHFHYDPFWWNTQAGYLSTWDELPPDVQEQRRPGQAPAFDLVRAHLDLARRDTDYKFVLAELDYLKPYWDLYPEDRADLRKFIAAGRVELVGSMYNEPNTNLTSLESTIRNVVYGHGFQRHVIGGDPQVAWMLDVFGHDPSYPAVMADAGLTASCFARGPFHKWGPEISTGDSTGMQFPSEFEWIAPDGRGLLSGYLPHHYPAGWRLNEVATLAEAEEEAYMQFRSLKRVAATRNVLLPVGYNHVVPARWTTEIHRDWNKRYVWPRFVCGLPGEFFGQVRAEAKRRNIVFSPQSRDMNPAYPGKEVSYIDVKQAQRATETTLLGAEKVATLVSLLGASYPAEAIDKAWRQLCFGAHHDGITGVMSDQVYVDLIAGWREAYELASGVLGEALRCLSGHVDTRGVGEALLVFNTQSWCRTDVAIFTARFGGPGPADVQVLDEAGRPVPSVSTGIARHADGTLAVVTLSFVAADVPATGYRVYRLTRTARPADNGWRVVDGLQVESDAFLVAGDPDRGGALTRILDKRHGKELVRAGEVAGELVCHDEYPEHPQFGKGPWHITPKGIRQGASGVRGTVRAEICPVGQRLVTTCRLGGLSLTSEVTLWDGIDRIEFKIRADGSIGQDRLLRARFPLDIEGARPVYEVGNAVIGRSFGYTDVDVAEHPFVLDCPAGTWAGLSSTARVTLNGAGTSPANHAIGVAEIVADEGTPEELRALVVALARQGVTATVSRPAGPRHGSLRVDSNLPDVRLSVGTTDRNGFTAKVLASADPWYRSFLDELITVTGKARLWVPAIRSRDETWQPGAELCGERDLPVLIVAGRDTRTTAEAIAELIADLADATIDTGQPAGPGCEAERLEDYSAGLLNRGTPGVVAEPDGTLHLSLMRSCSGWPSGTWIDQPRRTAPDGSSFALQHWSHTFEYALACGPGDWRQAGMVRAGHAYNNRFLTCEADVHPGDLPSAASLLAAEPDNVTVTTIKPLGNPLAAGQPATSASGITIRCYETAGQPTSARIHCFAPLRDGVLADILERPRARADSSDGTLGFDLGPAATVTVTAVPDTPEAEEPGSVLGPRREAAQPVFARYWLHNRGPAPAGYHPAMVYLEPRVIELAGPATVQLIVSATGNAAGKVDLIIPPGITVTSQGGLDFDLSDGYRRFELLVAPDANAVPGVCHLAARIPAEHGQVVEDVCTIRMGAASLVGTRITARMDPPALEVCPGESSPVYVLLTNHCLDEVRGEAQLITPFGTWDITGPRTHAFAIPPGKDRVLKYQVRVPEGAPPAASWVLIKVMSFGEITYTESIPLTIGTTTTF